MLNIEREIARHIVLSQISSDAGKGIKELHINGDKKAYKLGYKIKDAHIEHAIKLINKNKLNSFRYWVERKPDQNGHMSNVVYFTYKNNEIRLQISFHCFSRTIRGHVNKGVITEWTKIKNCRENCGILKEIFNL